MMSAREQLLNAIAQAPEPLIEEVLDFLLFAQARHYPKLDVSKQPAAKRQWSPHFFERTAGVWQGDPLVREEQGQQAEHKSF